MVDPRWKGLVFLFAVSFASLPEGLSAQTALEMPDRARTVLVEHCLSCHGPGTHKGGLDLSTRERVLEGGDSGPALEPGRAGDSLLIEKVSAREMPPKNPLTAEQIGLLRSWIDSGAAYANKPLAPPQASSTGWALTPLTRPAVPDVTTVAWARTPIDRFIQARLELEGLTPSHEADRRTLIRRLSFDLTGLPPTFDEIERFDSDPSPAAYERLVDRLLASPAYGEFWGRHWLDVVHYADTHGYDKDKRRDHAWPYRDAVIRALNSDVPYDRFVHDQIAGDATRPTDRDAVVASGFVAAGPWDFVGHAELAEGTVEKAKTRVIDRDDMVANTMSSFVSLTVHCARCHDHKFDPITTREYYRLQAVFAGVDRGDRTLEDPELAQRRQALQVRLQAIRARREEISRRHREAMSPELAALDCQIAGVQGFLEENGAARPSEPSPSNGYHSAVYASPENDAWVQVDLGRPVPIDQIRVVPARPTDFPDTPGFGFPLRFRVEVFDEPDGSEARVVSQGDLGPVGRSADVPLVIDGPLRARFVRVTASRLWERSHDYVFALAELEAISYGKNVALGAEVTARDSIEAGRWSTRFLVDGFDSRHKRPDPADPRAVALERERRVLQNLQTERDARAWAVLGEAAGVEFHALETEIGRVDGELRALPPPPLVYGLLSHEPRPIHVLNRGEVEQAGDEVSPGALQCVPGLDPNFDRTSSGPEGARRAALADWITSQHNPLTWRSIANRIWNYHFGRGVVDTPNDFGKNGSQPSHPELLDWLAVELRDGGSGLKALHRSIVTSAVYRQASTENAAAQRLDSENRLLSRQNRRRLEAEEIRDAILAASGQLDRRMFGPGFDVFRFKDDHSPTYDHEDPEAAVRPAGYRRAVYRFVVRSVPNPWVECLDGADPNASVPVRNVTVTPLQALALLNDPFVIDQAQWFARRLEAHVADKAAQVGEAFRIALGREPSGSEQQALATQAGRHGLASACRILLNLNEFVFVD
jgi:hypothetical protein